MGGINAELLWHSGTQERSKIFKNCCLKAAAKIAADITSAAVAFQTQLSENANIIYRLKAEKGNTICALNRPSPLVPANVPSLSA